MLSTVTVTLSALSQTTRTLYLDPLEQFDVLSASFPLIGSFGVTNLSLLLAFNLVVMAS